MHFANMYLVDERGLKCFHNLGECNEPHQTTVNITCSVKYVGNILPTLYWRATGLNFTNWTEIREDDDYNSAVTTLTFEPRQLLFRNNTVVRMICEIDNLTVEYKNHTQPAEYSLGKCTKTV